MHSRRRHSRAVLIARKVRSGFLLASPECVESHRASVPWTVRRELKGAYGGGDPPLPIPNREVKPARADGTARAISDYGEVAQLVRAHDS